MKQERYNWTSLHLQKIKNIITIKFLNFQTPENFAINYLKFKQRGQTIEHFVQKIQME